MQDLGPVIGELGRLAQVQLRDDAGVGYHARIGGEKTGHVFPERHFARAQGPAHQRGGQIGAAAAEGGHGALLGEGAVVVFEAGAADEPWDDRNATGGAQGPQTLARLHIGEHEVREGTAERTVREHDLRGVHVEGIEPRPGEGGREHRRGEALPATDHEIARARGQLFEGDQAGEQALELAEGTVDLGADRGRRAFALARLFEDVPVATAQLLDPFVEPLPLARDGAGGQRQQRVGHPRRGGDHHHAGRLPSL